MIQTKISARGRWAIASLCCLVFFSASAAYAASRHLYDIEIPLEEGAVVSAHLEGGETRPLGTVAMLPETSRWPSYTASAWGRPGTVAASAVNAVHLLMSVEGGHGRTMSLIPKQTIAPAAGPGAAAVIDARAGSGLFGAWAPPVGAAVSVRGALGERPLGTEVPSHGEVLVIRVDEEDMPYMVDFENRPGGRVISWSDRGGPQVIGRVIRRLGGCGRFAGTLFQEAGRIRAAHTGVIDVSTCPYGETGGFQIIPWDHALTSKEMQGAWNATQWMIIAPPDGSSMMGASHPLFSGCLVPGTADGEELWDFWSTHGRRPIVMARLEGGPWQAFPQASGKDDYAFARVSHIRIYFPFTKEPGM